MLPKIPVLAFGLCLSATSAFAGTLPTYGNFRMDCRFYDAERHSCVSSATYQGCISDCQGQPLTRSVQYGVLCDRQTIYNNEGVAFSTTDPASKVEDHVRPVTSSVPKTVLLWQGALFKEGTYDANLELSTHKITDGSCDITQSVSPKPTVTPTPTSTATPPPVPGLSRP